ncbi:MAG: CDP-alcohol phosphatidyltransferase family protein [Kiritimatiellia bacterium]
MQSKIVTVPNLISFVRILLAPSLLAAGLLDAGPAFLWIYAASLISDFLDGFLARLLDQQSKLGSQLDTIGDVLTGFFLIIGGSLIWPELIRQERYGFLAIILMLAASGIVTLAKYHHLPSYHTWSAKGSTVVCGVGAWFLFADISPWMFRAGVMILVLSAVEEIAITLILPRWQPNVPHVLHALKLRREAGSAVRG